MVQGWVRQRRIGGGLKPFSCLSNRMKDDWYDATLESGSNPRFGYVHGGKHTILSVVDAHQSIISRRPNEVAFQAIFFSLA